MTRIYYHGEGKGLDTTHENREYNRQEALHFSSAVYQWCKVSK